MGHRLLNLDTPGKGLHFRAISRVSSLVGGVSKDMSRLEEEMEHQMKGKDTKHNIIMEMAWNWESEVLESNCIICFCENIKS